MKKPSILALGRPSLSTRVERWECDYNGHWNVRFFARSFQLAAERLIGNADVLTSGTAAVRARYIRFHRELFTAAPVEVRSAVLRCRVHGAVLVHLLVSDGTVAATALDRTEAAIMGLPIVTEELVAMALPRKLDFSADPPICPVDALTTELGPNRPYEVDHTGDLLDEEIMRRVAIASQHQLTRLGFTPGFTERTNVSRMAAELVFRRHGSTVAGRCLTASSWLHETGKKNFITRHALFDLTGRRIATIEQNLLTVNLKTRRAVEIPELLQKAVKMK